MDVDGSCMHGIPVNVPERSSYSAVASAGCGAKILQAGAHRSEQGPGL